jgi:ribosomal protein S11
MVQSPNFSALPVQYKFRKGIIRKVLPVYHTLTYTVTANNSFVTVGTPEGATLFSSHLGILKVKGGRKRLFHYSRYLGRAVIRFLRRKRIRVVDLTVRGGARFKRVALLKGIRRSRIFINSWKNDSSTPFNGCRLPKLLRR